MRKNGFREQATKNEENLINFITSYLSFGKYLD